MLPCLTFNNSLNDLTFCRQLGVRAEPIPNTSLLLHTHKKNPKICCNFFQRGTLDLRLPRSISHSGSTACQEDSYQISTTEQHTLLSAKYPAATPAAEIVKYLRDNNYRGQKQFTHTATTSSSLTSLSLNFAILRGQRWKGATTGLQQNMKNKEVTCSPGFNNFIYASLTYKPSLRTQDYKMQGMGSSSFLSECSSQT